ncbi:hypothetical protein [Flammeovirga agarivorans]|uniref:Uncharacterized protein n=1 Tax=Flammeovirga agarivorans TaxID=2726742 RepID=A0A7X8SIG4_9BACT|nr:hypothetical protein [Flammeovirga agarivorans]NLR90732.1 hypothetical protein [Flammeovirga agarivorans]
MKYTHILKLATLILLPLFSCQQEQNKEVEKKIIIRKEFKQSKDDGLYKQFGNDVVEVKVKDFITKGENVSITAEVKNAEGTSLRTIELPKEKLLAILNAQNEIDIESVANSEQFLWKTQEGTEEELEHGVFLSEEYEEEMSAIIKKEYGQGIKSINSINVDIENNEATINAEVLLSDGQVVQKTIKKKTEEMTGGEDEVVKVKMIQIEGK